MQTIIFFLSSVRFKFLFLYLWLPWVTTTQLVFRECYQNNFLLRETKKVLREHKSSNSAMYLHASFILILCIVTLPSTYCFFPWEKIIFSVSGLRLMETTGKERFPGGSLCISLYFTILVTLYCIFKIVQVPPFAKDS